MKPATLIRTVLTRMTQLFALDISRIYQSLAQGYPDAPLMTFQFPLDFSSFDGESLTGRQLQELGFKVARALTDRGLVANDRVIIAKSDHPDYLIYQYSTLAAGGVPVAVNPKMGWSFVAAVQALTSARYILTDEVSLLRDPKDPGLLELLGRQVEILVVGRRFGEAALLWHKTGRVHHLHPEIEAAPASPPAPRTLADDTPVAIFHTSGTTGVPKCCVWTRRNTARIWRIMLSTLPIGPRSRCLLTSPASHALSFALGTGALLFGAQVRWISRFDPRECLETIQRDRITHYMGLPYTYMRMAAEDLFKYDLRSIKVWSTGADKVHAAHIRKMVQHGSLKLTPWGCRGSLFLDSYGSTEIGAGGVIQLWGPHSSPEPCVQGKPMPSQFAYRIVDEQWRDLPRGEVGRILVKSTTHFAGYWNDHTTWAQSRIDGWWWGGDVGRTDEKGRLLFLDREIDSVRTPEGTLYSIPVEERLLEHPRVMEAAVFQRNRPQGPGSEAVAWVVPAGMLTRKELARLPFPAVELEAELLEYVNAVLPTGPRVAEVRVVALEEIPLGVTGKVLKRRLRELSSAPLQIQPSERILNHE